jgi:hypothetical protein
MPAYGYVNGEWQQVLNIATYKNGAWTLVTAAYEYNGSAWEQYYSNNSYEVIACGLEQTVVPSADHGLWMNGVQVLTSGRSYNVVLFDNYGNISATETFDVFADAGSSSGTNTQNLINYLAGLNAGQIYLIFTYDEPSTGAANLTSAFTSLFGGNDSILSSSMPYRGAYVAMGKKGSAPWLERYCGTYMDSVSNSSATTPQTDQGCLDGCLQYTFQMYTTEGPNGEFVNQNTLYQGGDLDSNFFETGMTTVSGLGVI